MIGETACTLAYTTQHTPATATETAGTSSPYIEGAYKAGGGTIVANETLTPGLTSYRTEALKVARAGTPKGA